MSDKILFATTESVTVGDCTFSTGDLVRIRGTELTGMISQIKIPFKYTKNTSILIDPDDIDLAKKCGVWWPIGGGKEYIEIRDSGVSLWRIEHVESDESS